MTWNWWFLQVVSDNRELLDILAQFIEDEKKHMNQQEDEATEHIWAYHDKSFANMIKIKMDRFFLSHIVSKCEKSNYDIF